MEENNENVVEETTQDQTEETPQEETPQEEIPKVDFSKFNTEEEEITKIDLTQPPPDIKEDADTEQETTDVVTDEQSETVQEVVEEVSPEQTPVSDEESGAIEEVEEEEEIVELPEKLQKLMEFMEDTGGDINDFVKLNSNIDEMDDSEILQDYYKRTKPHLNHEEISFLLEDRFSYDEEEDGERDVKRKKVALKEQVAEAKAYLDGQKSKYYEDIKAGSKLTGEQQKAVEFFNRYSQEEEANVKVLKHQQSTFLNKTDKVFNNDFKGFEFNVGDKKMTYKINNGKEIRDKQVDINNFVGKFLNDKALMDDAAGYHKSLFTAMNPDAIANHFYEQGKSDAIKQSISETKNINTSRGSHKVYEGDGGIKFTVLEDDSHDMKLRYKKRNIN